MTAGTLSACCAHPAVPALISITLISAVPLGAILLLARATGLARIIPSLVAIAIGALLASAFLELIPEALRRTDAPNTTALLTLTGFLAFLFADRFFWHGDSGAPHRVSPVVSLNYAGVVIHNAIDGMVIAASFTTATALGISTSIAIFLHEIPHELGDFGIFVSGGLTARRAAWLNFTSAIGAYAGAVAVVVVGTSASRLPIWIMPFAAGNFVYIAAASLVPALRRERQPLRVLMQLALVAAGAAVVAIPVWLGGTG